MLPIRLTIKFVYQKHAHLRRDRIVYPLFCGKLHDLHNLECAISQGCRKALAIDVKICIGMILLCCYIDLADKKIIR